MSSSAGALLVILLIITGLVGLMLPKEKPPRPPDEIHHVFKNRRD